MNTRWLVAATVLALLPASAVHAQQRVPVEKLSLRPFFLVSIQTFAAQKSFDAAFDTNVGPFWGGGLELTVRDRFYVDVSASQFKKTGQQAFLFNDQAFQLGIPMTATVTPFEVSAGYRFLPGHRLNPYAGAGFGTYAYHQTSDFADPSEDVDTRHSGFLVGGGVEFRAHRWIGVSVDVQYSHVPGILGTAGLSQTAGEDDLGGVAARFRVIVGK